ncbi:hypothetical protein ACFLV5_03550 [Chloroflexota bacterium]
MDKTISINITDKKTSGVVFDEQYSDCRQFRIVYFKDGLVYTLGKLPWKMMKGPLKKYARKWAEAHYGEFEALVRQYRPETTDEEIIGLLDYMKKEATVMLPTREKRNAAVGLHILQEMLEALEMTVRRVANEIKNIWDFSQSVIDESHSTSILGWLFRRR